MNKRKILGIFVIFSSILLTVACGSHVKIRDTYELADVKKVCILSLYQLQSKKGNTALENLLINSFDNFNIPTVHISQKEDSRKFGCSHYLSYAAKSTINFTQKAKFRFYVVDYNSSRFFNLASIATKETIYFDGSNNSQELVDRIVHTLLTGNEEAKF